MPLSPKQKLGAYEIVSSLGAGGMGEVYRARDSRLGRDVALKVLPPEVTNEPGRLERFDREARAIAALNHPHLVTIFSTEEADGIRFLTMEVVDGCTLGDLIVPSGMAVTKFLEIALPLADALAAAHQKQITHRDLKPGNVMVSNDGRVKVLDFGLARVGGGATAEETLIATAAPITHRGTIVGTMPYMSPEQVEGRQLDTRTDLFSLGVIFYELLSGTRPFSGSSSPALMSAILRDTPSSICEKRPEIPDALDRLISRLLEKRPEDRVQTARDVFNELRHAQKQLESGVRPRPAVAEASIAVLPFSDLSATRDQDWFCDGIAEELLNALAGLPGLRVAARASAFSLRGKGDDLRSIGEKLNVSTVLEGSVRRAGDRVRITAQLSDAREGRQLWSERFDREIKDIFDVQEEIARAIVERLRLTISGDSSERLVQKTTTNIEAYQLLLKGRRLVTQRGRAVLDAIPFFEGAIALDHNLAEAHALLGDAYRLLGLYGIARPGEVMPKARACAERALAVDPMQPEALATLAIIASIYEWDMDEFRRRSDRALAADPLHPRALTERGIAIAFIGQPNSNWQPEAIEVIARAALVDPLNAWIVAMQGALLMMIGRVAESVDVTRRALELDANNFTAHWLHVAMLSEAGRHDEALKAAEPALAMSGRHTNVLTNVATIYAERGQIDKVEAIRVELRERAERSYIGYGAQASVAAAAGRIDEARDLLAKAIADHDPFISFWKLYSWRPVWKDEACAAMLHACSLFKGTQNLQQKPGV
jgi:serine/threonine protein kinase